MRVAVVGAGISGLYSIKSCLEGNLEPVCFERYGHIGGMWNYRDDDDIDSARVYESLRLNASRHAHLISDFPDEEGDRDDSPSVEQHLKYIHKYVRHFKLDTRIKFHHEVLSVEPSVNHQLDKKWSILFKVNDVITTEVFDAVMVCTGRFRVPIMPDIPGMDEFEGTVCPANKFKHNRQSEIRDKNVLIIGNSFSAGDFAAIMAQTTKQVWLSIGKGCSIIGYTFNGPKPIGVEGSFYRRDICKSADAMQIMNAGLVKASDQIFPERESYGITPGGLPIVRPIMIQSDLPDLIRSGKVKVKPKVTKMMGKVVMFDDGLSCSPDTIYCATGYEISFPFLSESIVPSKSSQLELFKFVFPMSTEHHNLVFIGCTVNPFTLNVTYLELQARWAVQVLTGNSKLPSKAEMREEIKKRKDLIIQTFGEDRGQMEAPGVVTNDFLAEQIGCLPSFWKMALTDPYLAYIYWYGLAYSCHYRLVGPNKWPQARKTAIKLYREWRRMKGDGWNWKKIGMIGAVSLVAPAIAAGIWHAGP